MIANGDPPDVRIPPLTSPFPVEISPHVHQVQADTMAWVARHGLLSEPQTELFHQARYGHLAAYVYPYAAPTQLQLVSDWCTWLFAADDVIYETTRGAAGTAHLMPDMWRVLSGQHSAGGSPFAIALGEIRQRVAELGGPWALRRWREATIAYLFAQTWEAANRECDTIPTLADYLCMRRDTGAMFTVFALIDLAAERPLTDEQWNDVDVRAASVAAVDVVVYDNDLFSYAKERDTGNAPNNLVTVLMAAGRQPQDAVTEVVTMRNAAVARVKELSERTRGRGPAVEAYMRGLQYWISGSVEYSPTSSRYTLAPANVINDLAGPAGITPAGSGIRRRG